MADRISALDYLNQRDKQTETATSSQGTASKKKSAFEFLEEMNKKPSVKETTSKIRSGSTALVGQLPSDGRQAPLQSTRVQGTLEPTPAAIAPGPRRSILEKEPVTPGKITNATIKAPEKSTLRKVGEFALGKVLKGTFESLIGGPISMVLPEDFKRKTFSADEKTYVESAERGFTMGVEQYKRLADRADKFVASSDSRLTPVDRSKAALDLGSSLIVDAGGAIFNAALEVGGSSPLGKAGKQNMENAIGFIAEKGGQAAEAGSKFIPMDEETRRKLDPSIREFGGALAIMATFWLGAKGGAKVSKIDRFGDTLGLKRVVDDEGKARPVTTQEVQEAFKSRVGEVIAEGVDVDAKMDVLKSAESVMRSYAEMGPEKFDAEVQPQLDRFEAKAEQIMDDVRGMAEEGVAQTKANTVEGVLKDPITPATTRALKKMDKEMQFAFEQEVFDMNAKNDPNLAKQADEAAGVNYERFADPFDTRPAYYDVQRNTIRLNEAVIGETLDALMRGKVLKIGEGRLVSTIRKITGESFEKLKTRYEKELVKHEAAHAKTIKPEDVARLETAIREGNKVEAEKIRVDLEERASKYVVEDADKLTPEIDRSLDAEIARTQILRDSRGMLENLKFAIDEREHAYQRWREIVRRNADYEKLNFDEFEKKLKESPAYKDKSVKALFEDGLDRGDLATNVGTFDDLFDRFHKRLESEQKIRQDYKTARLEQKTLFPEAEKMDIRTRKAVRRAIGAELREQKLKGKVRDLELGKLRENIRRRLEKEVTQEKFERMSKKQQERFMRKEKRREIRGLIKRTRPERTKGGQLKGKFTAQTQAVLERVDKMLKMDRNDAISSVMQMVEDWRTTNPNEVYLPEDLARNVDIAEVAGLNKQSLEQLERTEAFIRSVMEEGKSERTEAQRVRREAQAETKADALETLTGSEKGLPPETRATIEGKGRIASGINSFWWDTGTMPEFAKALGGDVSRLMKETNNLIEIERAHLARKGMMVEELGRELYGRDWQREYYQDMRREVDLGEATFANGEKGKVKTTRLEAMGIYAGLRDAKFKANLLDPRGNAWTKEILGKVMSVLEPRDRQLIERIVKETYEGQYARFAKAAQERNGIALGKVEGYAGPIRYEADMSKKPDETPADILMDGLRRRLGVSTAGIQSRTGFTGKMRLSPDPIADALNYVRQTEHYIQMSEKMSDWDAIMRDGDIAQAAKKRFGQNFWNGFRAHIEDVRKGGIVREQQIDFNRKLQNATGDISASLIARPTVWAGQFSSIAQFRAEAKRGKNFWRGVRNFKENMPLLKKYAPAVEARALQGAAEYISRFEGERGRVRRGIEKIKKVFSRPLEAADRITTTLGASGVFEDRVDYYQKRGRSLEQARVEAGRDIADVITRTQSTQNFLGKSNLEKRSGIGQTFTTLRNQPNKIARAGVQAVIDYREGKISKKEMAQFLYWNNVVQPTMYYTLRYGTKGVMAALSAAVVGNVLGNEEGAEAIMDKAKGEGFMGGLAANMVNNATGFLVIGDLINLALENGVRGKNYEFRPSVLQAVFDDITSMFTQFNAGDWDEGAVLGIRALSRKYGIGDPGDLINTFLTTLSAKNKERKAEEAKTPERRAEAAQKRRAKAIEKRQKASQKK